MKLAVVLAVLVSAAVGSSQAPALTTCLRNSCETVQCRQICAKDCASGRITSCGCCDVCVIYLREGAACAPFIRTNGECSPGLTCQGGSCRYPLPTKN